MTNIAFNQIKYSTEPPIFSVLEEEVNNSTEIFQFYNLRTLGTVYLTVAVAPSSTNIETPTTPWFVNDTLAKTIVYNSETPNQDLTRVSFDEPQRLSYGVSDQYDKVFRRVGQMVKLPDNWDSYGGKPIKDHCIDNAYEILQYLLGLRDEGGIKVPAPFLAPLSSGGIQLEWEVRDRYLQIELFPNSSEIEYFATGKTNAGELSLEGSLKSLNNLRELLIWYISGEPEDLGDLNFEDFDEELAA